MNLYLNTDNVDIDRHVIGIHSDDGSRIGVFHDRTALGVCRATDRAKKIVKACNLHDELVEALEAINEALNAAGGYWLQAEPYLHAQAVLAKTKE